MDYTFSNLLGVFVLVFWLPSSTICCCCSLPSILTNGDDIADGKITAEWGLSPLTCPFLPFRIETFPLLDDANGVLVVESLPCWLLLRFSPLFIAAVNVLVVNPLPLVHWLIPVIRLNCESLRRTGGILHNKMGEIFKFQ